MRGTGPQSRREFLTRLVFFSALAAVWFSICRRAAAFGPRSWTARRPLDPAERRTLEAVQESLFPPAPGVPGAREIRAAAYLANALDEPRLERGERRFIRRGLARLERECAKRHGTSFVALSGEQRETVLQHLAAATSWGKNWLAALLRYLFEALLGDPVYGGNPGGIGWQWLGIQAGFPRPPADKTYRSGYAGL